MINLIKTNIFKKTTYLPKEFEKIYKDSFDYSKYSLNEGCDLREHLWRVKYVLFNLIEIKTNKKFHKILKNNLFT
jgi:hypothetical protein